jgi:hypothetical protein
VVTSLEHRSDGGSIGVAGGACQGGEAERSAHEGGRRGPRELVQRQGAAGLRRPAGIAMDDAPDLETLQDRLNRIQDTWNALPIHERQRLMPHPGRP